MRILFWAVTLGAMAGSAGQSGAWPTQPGVFEQFPEQTFALVANEAGDVLPVMDSGINSWISAVSFSAPQYEALSTMAGFHEAPETGPESPLASREPTFDWDWVDALHGPGDLKGLVPELRHVLSGEDDSIHDVAHTGSPAALEAQSGPHESAWALDSL